MTSGSRVQIQPPLPRKTQALSLRAGGFFFCLTWGLIIGNYPLATGGGAENNCISITSKKETTIGGGTTYLRYAVQIYYPSIAKSYFSSCL